MSQNLAQRIGQEFKTLRADELSLKADAVTLSNMFEQPSDEIVFKGNLVPAQGSTFSIGNADARVKDLFLSGSLSIGTSGTIDIAGYTFGSTQFKVDNDLRVDGNVALGDGNDSITVNAGASNNFLINAKNVSLDVTGTLTGAKITEAQITDLKAYVTTSSAQALKSSGALTKVGNVMHLNKADGSSETIDLSVYLDNTNLVTSVAGKTGAVSLSASDISGLSTVATSGSYNDLANKPTIGNATITVRGTGTLGGAGSFGLNATANSTIDITHGAVTRTNTSSSVAPAAGSAFTVIDGVTTSTDGHVTGVNVKTVSLPAVVVPTKADVGLGNVDNTADSAKNVASAAKLTTARTISATGDASWSASFDGSANSTAALTLANTGVTAGTYAKVTVDVKGRVTGGSSLAATDVPNLAASKITSGTVADARLPNIAISKVTNLQSALNAKISNPASGAAGDILYHNGTSYIRLAKGTNGQVLKMVNDLPVWADSTIG